MDSSTFIGKIVGALALLAVGLFLYIHFGEVLSPVGTFLTPAVLTAPLTAAVSTSTTPKTLISQSSVAPESTIKENSTNTVIAPTPLRLPTTAQTSDSSILTVSGVLADTNAERAENGGLPALTENRTLDLDAQIKLQDMFTKQYFEHKSPTGVGPAELANLVGYSFVLVGENLALGDFGSDQGLLTAWMNSPGHRANILNPEYQEIGVAVGKGMYEGRSTWLAVQSFGMPRSACPIIDDQLKAQIDITSVKITGLRGELDTKKVEIDITPQDDPNYNLYVDEYNSLVPQYNGLVDTNRTNVDTYNAEIRAYNACVSTASAHLVSE